jgi:hypothetical protein
MGLQVLCVEPDAARHARLVKLREHVFGSGEAWGMDWCAAAACCRTLVAAAGRTLCWVLDTEYWMVM